MRRIADGDAAAVSLLVKTSLPRILNLAARLLRDRTEADDVAQEAYMRAYRQAPRWEDGRARIDTWLHTVTLNLCRDRLRRRRELVIDKLPEPLDPAPNPEAHLLDAECEQSVASAVHALPERQRDAILLVHYQELPASEAAKALGISIEALESLLSRGRRNLKDQFARQERVDD